MTPQSDPVDKITYYLGLILPDSFEVLVVTIDDVDCLPTVQIPHGVRIARELQKAVYRCWNLDVIVIDVMRPEKGEPAGAICEVRGCGRSTELTAVGIERLYRADVHGSAQDRLAAALNKNSFSNDPFSKPGWINAAIAWFEAETGKRHASRERIEQYSAGSRFALLRLRAEDESNYWFKASSGAGECELPITQALLELCPAALPVVIAAHQEWGAWLTEDAGTPLPERPDFSIMQQAVGALAKLQRCTVLHTDILMKAGALDRRPNVLHRLCPMLFDYLEEAMAQQVSEKAPRIEVGRLRQMRRMAEESCLRLEEICIPDSIVHGDMNRGNVMWDGSHCRFLDWREGYVGNPLACLDHLLLLRSSSTTQQELGLLHETYSRIWRELVPEWKMSAALTLAPVVAGLSALYGRGDWIHSELRSNPARLRYARNIARHLNRELRSWKPVDSSFSVPPCGNPDAMQLTAPLQTEGKEI